MSYPSINPPVLSILLLVALMLGSCELLGDTSSPDYASISDISYTRHVQVLFQDRCQSCHGTGASGLRLSSWESMTRGGGSGGVVIPFDPDRSRLIRMLTIRSGGPHPTELGKETVTGEELDFLKRWIKAGARNDRDQVPYSNLKERVITTLPEKALIAVVDPTLMAVARIIDLQELGFRADSRPTYLASGTSDGSWFVTLPGEGVILEFGPDDVLRGLTERTSGGPLAVSSDGSWLLTSQPGDGNDVVAVRTATSAGTTLRLAFPENRAVAIHSADRLGYAVSRAADQVATFALTGGTVGYTAIPGPRHGVESLRVSLAGDLLVAAGRASGQALLFSLVRPEAPSYLGAVRMGQELRAPVLTPEGLYGLGGEGRIVLAEASAGATATTFLDVQEASALVFSAGRLLALNPNDKRLHVPATTFVDGGRVGVVLVIDPSTRTVLRRIELDGRPEDLTAAAAL